MVWMLIAGICRRQCISMTKDGIYLLAADIATDGVEWTPIGIPGGYRHRISTECSKMKGRRLNSAFCLTLLMSKSKNCQRFTKIFRWG